MNVRLLAVVSVALSVASFPVRAQLLISEFLANPSGTDSPFEWVELVAANNIDFSLTPYSVVFANNTSTGLGTNGWITGANVTYGFNINAGVVSRGDVVYVGGSSMAPTGTKLRVINTATTAGDGFGLAASGGVLGNGGTAADAIGVFNTSIDNVTASLVPVDAIFFGGSPTGAVVNGGTGGYVLPVNDAYSGGFLQTNSFVAPDPASGATIIAAGTYNTDSATWEAARNWVSGTMSDGTTSLTLTPVPEPSTLALLVAGCAVGALALRRKR